MDVGRDMLPIAFGKFVRKDVSLREQYGQSYWPMRHGQMSRENGRWSSHLLRGILVMATPWKINMEHNHRGLEDHVPF